MTAEDVSVEVERSREYLHALIDVRCELHKRHNPYRAVTKAYPLSPPTENPQLYYLWRSRDEYEQRKGALFQEAVRIHSDGTWTFQPTVGIGHLCGSVVMYRTYRSVYGCRHSVSPWSTREPSGMNDIRQA